jgi:hypothetical protein
MKAHQPGSTPIDIPETVPNPAYTPAPTPAPAPERAPTKVPEKVPEKVIDHALIDVLEAIKAGATECGVTAERIDEDERNDRITDRILESIRKAGFVIVDLTNERPNVLFEAGYAHGIGKIPIYVAREGTTIHFDIKDYPVIMFRNMKELREGVARRLRAIATKK